MTFLRQTTITRRELERRPSCSCHKFSGCPYLAPSPWHVFQFHCLDGRCCWCVPVVRTALKTSPLSATDHLWGFPFHLLDTNGLFLLFWLSSQRHTRWIYFRLCRACQDLRTTRYLLGSCPRFRTLVIELLFSSYCLHLIIGLFEYRDNMSTGYVLRS